MLVNIAHGGFAFFKMAQSLTINRINQHKNLLIIAITKMIERLISFSLRNRFLVLLIASGIFVWGIYAVKTSKIDAIPDLSENQVIVFTEWMGRSPQIIEDQVTYPLVTNLQGIPKVKYVRANSIGNSLPEGVVPTMDPDGTGVGHVLWYTLHAPGMDLGEQRAVQDWYVKFALQNVPGVSEIASFGGFQKQYQINIDPNKLTYYKLSLSDIIRTVNTNNNEAGGRKTPQPSTARTAKEVWINCGFSNTH